MAATDTTENPVPEERETMTHTTPTAPVKGRPEPPEKPLPLAEIEAAVRGVRYGVVQIVIQDGVVVQIEKTEKLRLK